MNIQLPLISADTSIAMERVEARHQILDTYLWLAMRYPGRFLDVYVGLRRCLLACDTPCSSTCVARYSPVAEALRLEATSQLERGLERMSKNTEACVCGSRFAASSITEASRDVHPDPASCGV